MRFWEDTWAGNCSFAESYPSLYRISFLHNEPIASFAIFNSDAYSQFSSWNFHFFRNLRESEMSDLCCLFEQLEGVSIQHNEEDIRRWALESSGVFSCKSFFTSFFPIDTNPPFPWFKDVWKTPVPKKVQLFSWLMVLGKLLTCDILQKHFPNALLSPNWCVLCRGDTEDLNHLLLHCPFSSTLWNRVLNELGLSWVKPQAVVNLFSLNLGSHISKRGKVLWRVIVQALCWSLWLERNKRVFEDCHESLEDVWDRVKFRVAWWVSIHKDFKTFPMSDIVRDWSLVL